MHSLRQRLRHILRKNVNKVCMHWFDCSQWTPLQCTDSLFEQSQCCLSIQTDRGFEVSLGSAQIKGSYPSLFVKLKYCWQYNWKARGCQTGGASTLLSVVFFGRVEDLRLLLSPFPVWISYLHGKIFLVCLDFHCVDNIKGAGMGCGKRECAVFLSACFDVCLTALVRGWCQWIHKVNCNPLPNSDSLRETSESLPLQISHKTKKCGAHPGLIMFNHYAEPKTFETAKKLNICGCSDLKHLRIIKQIKNQCKVGYKHTCPLIWK